MHYVTDVVAGVVLGIVCVAITAMILSRTTSEGTVSRDDRRLDGVS
jgi:membrane-associated phospholipid phosphatase